MNNIYKQEKCVYKEKLLGKLNNDLYCVDCVERNSSGQIVERIEKHFAFYSEALEFYKECFTHLTLKSRLERARTIKHKIERKISDLWENPQATERLKRLHKHNRTLWKFISLNDPSEQKANNRHWLDVYFL